MKLDILSDLHIENESDIKEFECLGDILVIAGDISKNPDITTGYLNLLSERYKAVLFTIGNIELWHHSSINSVINSVTKNLKKNVYLLDILKGITVKEANFCGGIYFSKQFLTPNDSKNLKFHNLSDVLEKLEKKSKSNLHKKIKTLKPKVIITHYPPLSVLNMEETETRETSKYETIWIFGHYHQYKKFFATDKVSKKTLYVCNCNSKPLTLEL